VDQVHPAQQVWSQYKVRAADVDGDLKSDLILYTSGSPASVYVALAK
jgi:hypothetical protein